ncbi:ADP-ribosylation factor [Spironucleus salmonicida]|uniref:ADP-ribosylation factor n=1 Tax=Spironucleus salmonicida TaxID=348837 RepID=V6LGN6_9EUKA|nr:ADP-ribosylation factor [Spironucleus salmonicida]|eukprot:EST43667.1 ADP-ribosylation factor [Spironucleus salmonicida]
MGKQKPSQKPYEVMFIGVDNAGKSTIIKQACGDESLLACHPTMGCDSRMFCHEIESKKCKPVFQKFYLVDLGGHSRIRDIWSRYYQTSVGVVFVFDAADESRFNEVRETFNNIIMQKELEKTPILVIANKQDLDAKIKDEFDFFNTFKFKLKGKYKFVSGSATDINDKSIRAGVHWLFDQCMANSQLIQNAQKAVKDLQNGNKFAGLTVEQKFALQDQIAAKNDQIDMEKKLETQRSEGLLATQLDVTHSGIEFQEDRVKTPHIGEKSYVQTPDKLIGPDSSRDNKIKDLASKVDGETKPVKIKKLLPGEF